MATAPRRPNPGRRFDAVFERFETSARHAIVLAQAEASRLKHNYIGTEHELLGVLRVGDPVVQAAVGSKLSVEAARKAVEEIVGTGDEVPSGHIPFTPRAKKVLELSLREALRLRHRSISGGHIVLGLLREGEGVGAQVLAGAGIDFDEARAAIEDALGPGTAPPELPTARGFLRSFRRRPPLSVISVTESEIDPEEAFDWICTEAALAALNRARGDELVSTPWSLLAAIGAGGDAAADLLAGLDLSGGPSEEPSGESAFALIDRARELTSGLGGEGAKIDTLHLLAVLLSPGEGSVADDLAERGADPVELLRQVLAQF